MSGPGRHLALFIRSLGANGAGAERIWLNLARAFAERGHRVDLVLGRRSGHLAQNILHRAPQVTRPGEAFLRLGAARPLL